MKAVFERLNKTDNAIPIKRELPPADTDYQSKLIKIVSDSKLRLEALKRRVSNESVLSPLPVIEEDPLPPPPPPPPPSPPSPPPLVLPQSGPPKKRQPRK